MARAINRMSARTVQTLAEPGRHADGDGLYLVIDQNGGKRWVFLYRLAGRRREMGLGSLRTISLAKARELANRARTMVAQREDPIEARQAAAPSPDPAPIPSVPTFAKVAEAFMDERDGGWRNAKHRQQWRTSLMTYAAGLWEKPVSEIGTSDVLAVLRPIWREKPETASRLRGRIERVLDAAKVEGHRQGENPARWRGHLEHTLPKPGKLSRGHHPALRYAEVPAFVAALRTRVAASARALELIILTAARSGEVRGMRASEVDLDAAIWTVPAERMKAGRQHRVPFGQMRAVMISPPQLLPSLLRCNRRLSIGSLRWYLPHGGHTQHGQQALHPRVRPPNGYDPPRQLRRAVHGALVHRGHCPRPRHHHRWYSGAPDLRS
ncbi:hypothetical protein ABID82_000544 [Methylobacterium sp. PvP062]|uniref:Core-binding (CB) domain-containing protein n=1 Tax=Methylobacterium radiotolerans TaxID=31998 RepID=A0ABV2N9H8_9HYPH|nr:MULTISPECIES: integrase arm-type DNA-binding domain-containing protein [unclassified Methylobacterium]MBP2493647.1 hypothetical protein [Methylobacterium sp. PvP105]MBP2499980.1 hypothetical protein [Methylobacterium sp. PvP109]MCX7336310.1 integrase arm-type DNA-binding domain-containing protein [Hyphomicrobiales bacterium]